MREEKRWGLLVCREQVLHLKQGCLHAAGVRPNRIDNDGAAVGEGGLPLGLASCAGGGARGLEAVDAVGDDANDLIAVDEEGGELRLLLLALLGGVGALLRLGGGDSLGVVVSEG